MCFLDEAGRSFYRSWPVVAAGVVGNLRFALGLWPHDERLLDLIDELRGRSADFDRLWSAQAVQVKRNVAKEFLHPLVGPLDLDYQVVRRTRRQGTATGGVHRRPRLAERRPPPGTQKGASHAKGRGP